MSGRRATLRSAFRVLAVAGSVPVPLPPSFCPLSPCFSPSPLPAPSNCKSFQCSLTGSQRFKETRWSTGSSGAAEGGSLSTPTVQACAAHGILQRYWVPLAGRAVLVGQRAVPSLQRGRRHVREEHGLPDGPAFPLVRAHLPHHAQPVSQPVVLLPICHYFTPVLGSLYQLLFSLPLLLHIPEMFPTLFLLLYICTWNEQAHGRVPELASTRSHARSELGPDVQSHLHHQKTVETFSP
jgi:hypothetical protein